MTTNERELLLSLANVIVDGAGYEERVKIERLRDAVEREPFMRQRGETDAQAMARTFEPK